MIFRNKEINPEDFYEIDQDDPDQDYQTFCKIHRLTEKEIRELQTRKRKLKQQKIKC